MAGTITPVVHGGRRTGWGVSVALHALGAGLAAAAFGAVLGGGGALLGGPWGGAGLWAVALVAGAYALREAFGLPVPVPERRRQVPEWWRGRLGPRGAAFAYGLGLGVGFLTYLRHGTLVAVSAVALASGDPWIGALVLAPFGLARGLSLTAVASTRTSDEVRGVIDRLERIAVSALPRGANAAALVVLSAVALGAAAFAPLDAASVGALAAGIVAAVFAWAVAGKLLHWTVWRGTLPGYRLGPMEPVAAVGAPALEAVVVVLVLAGLAAAAGAVALALLAAASAALLRARGGGEAPCACFGRRRVRSVRSLLIRNGAIAAAAAASLWAESRPPSLPPADPLPLALALIGAAAAIALGVSAARWLRPPAAAGGTSPRARATSPGTPAGTSGR
ncbi:MAG TPA: MauE/DoxX family redox-associated membrane protein [Actinomycetota bacterium]